MFKIKSKIEVLWAEELAVIKYSNASVKRIHLNQQELNNIFDYEKTSCVSWRRKSCRIKKHEVSQTKYERTNTRTIKRLKSERNRRIISKWSPCEILLNKR